jgi:hypothetical protein
MLHQDNHKEKERRQMQTTKSAAELAKALAGIIGAEAAAPIIRQALELPKEDRRPLLADACELALRDTAESR